MKKDLQRGMFDKKEGVHIDIGCGENKQPGSIGVDLRQVNGVDIVQDLEKFPWSGIPDGVARLVTASHVLEHINPAGGIFVNFMDEVWRITQVGGHFAASLPYAGSPGYWQDPTHCNGCTEVTWAYFDPLAKDPFGNLYHLYTIYRPKPWEIVDCQYSIHGIMEVLFRKRAIDKSYRTVDNYKNEKKHGR